MQRQHLPGVAIAVVKDGKAIKEAGYGFANLEHEVKVTPDTVFQSGSIGKQFTAALVMLLVEDGKLKLDDNVATYLPGAPESWRGITLRHLLTHTSGLREDDPAIDLKRAYTEEDLMKSAFAIAPDHAPGEKWRYSNLGYQLLGFICSRAGGAFYGDQLHARIFTPLGMQSRIISERDLVPHRAAGYDRVDGEFYNQEWVSPSLNTTADGSLYLTVRDLARWSIALETASPLSESIKTAMRTSARLNDGSLTDYGFGWQLGSDKGHPFEKHSGSWQGFNSYITRYSKDGLAVIALTNRSNAELVTIVERISAHYLPELAAPPPKPLTAKLLNNTPIFMTGTHGDDEIRHRPRRIAPGLFELQLDLDAGWLAFKFTSDDGAIDLGSAFDEQSTKLAETKPVIQAGEYLVLELKYRTTYVFRLDARDPGAVSVIVREVTR
jgi:CubicO group peptidase (beta-lactamase class C family)